jgi:hypothetical protein
MRIYLVAFFIRLVAVLAAGEATVIKRRKTSSLSEGRVSNPPLLPYLPRLPQVIKYQLAAAKSKFNFGSEQYV